MNAPPIKVIRATWMYDEVCLFLHLRTPEWMLIFVLCKHRPVPLVLSKQLEELYKLVKPWQSSYQLELSTAIELGPEAHAKLKQRIDESQSIIFEDDAVAYIVS